MDESCQLGLSINGTRRDVYLTGVLEPSDDFVRRALDTLILTDISTAQSLSGTKGKLSQIDLILPDHFEPATLSKSLPAGVLLVPFESRNSQVAEMTAAFQINLTALSLLALLVGVFLIYNTMTFSVVQRRSVFGTLRSIGFTREQVFGMIVGEAALVGILGVVLGLGLGILLGQGAVKMVTQTINDLFFVVEVRGIQIPTSSLIKGALAGFLASLFAAAAPAWEAASVMPRLALSRRPGKQNPESHSTRCGTRRVCCHCRWHHSCYPDAQSDHQFCWHNDHCHWTGGAYSLRDGQSHGHPDPPTGATAGLDRPPRPAECDPFAEPHGSCRSCADDRGLGYDRCPGHDHQFSHNSLALAGTDPKRRCLCFLTGF